MKRRVFFRVSDALIVAPIAMKRSGIIVEKFE